MNPGAAFAQAYRIVSLPYPLHTVDILQLLLKEEERVRGRGKRREREREREREKERELNKGRKGETTHCHHTVKSKKTDSFENVINLPNFVLFPLILTTKQ